MKWLVILIVSTLSCSLPVDNKFHREFEIIKNINIGMYNKTFKEVVRNRKTCEIVQLAFPETSERIDNFTCSIEDCQKWCYYNSNCVASFYGNGATNAYDTIIPSKNISCIRTSRAELIDSNKITFDNYNYRVFYRGVIPYRGSQYCVDYAPKKVCNLFGRCGWNRGKRGYNDQIQGDSSSGWCGRIKC